MFQISETQVVISMLQNAQGIFQISVWQDAIERRLFPSKPHRDRI